jgi:cytidyltransferase-like protein
MAIITLEDLAEIRKQFPDKKIVFCSGSFDLPHVGHILFFERCRKFGDLLVVAVGCDKIIKVNKGPKRPILNEEIRLKTIDSLKPVSYCIIDDVSTQENPLLLLDLMMEKLSPDVYVINEDAFNIPYRKQVSEKCGAELVVLKRKPEDFGGISTTQIIEKMKEL